MPQSAHPYLRKAQRALAAAQRDLDAGDAENAIARAYFAAYHAAGAALSKRGVATSLHEEGRHEEIQTRFYQLFVADHLLDRESAQTLALLYQLRKHADYLSEPFLTVDDAREAFGESTAFVEDVQAWMKGLA